ncbi:hypothetical protein [Edaphobacter aggregans]|uniref:hypothetical protein n=1 Tax=Edaphobacter aggregans TaxID=570835 RepID=UPI0012F800DE|nr:hypothetical protein [Edaphobacter aggregans]
MAKALCRTSNSLSLTLESELTLFGALCKNPQAEEGDHETAAQEDRVCVGGVKELRGVEDVLSFEVRSEKRFLGSNRWRKVLKS